MNAVTQFTFGIRDNRQISAYDALVDRLADSRERRRYGYQDASELSALTTAEVAVVLRAHPQEVTDALEWDARGDAEYLDRPLAFAARVQVRYEYAARRVLILDVQDEISRREQAEEWDR